MQLEMASVAGVDAASVVCLCDISEGESGADGACVACCWCASPHAAMPDSSRGVLSEAVGRACCVGAGACWFVITTCRGAYCRLVGVDQGVCVCERACVVSLVCCLSLNLIQSRLSRGEAQCVCTVSHVHAHTRTRARTLALTRTLMRARAHTHTHTPWRGKGGSQLQNTSLRKAGRPPHRSGNCCCHLACCCHKKIRSPVDAAAASQYEKR